jgi:hypothetical protein
VEEVLPHGAAGGERAVVELGVEDRHEVIAEAGDDRPDEGEQPARQQREPWDLGQGRLEADDDAHEVRRAVGGAGQGVELAQQARRAVEHGRRDLERGPDRAREALRGRQGAIERGERGAEWR